MTSIGRGWPLLRGDYERKSENSAKTGKCRYLGDIPAHQLARRFSAAGKEKYPTNSAPQDTTPQETAARFLGSHSFKSLKLPCRKLKTRHALANCGRPIGASADRPASYFFLGGTTASLKDFAKRNLTTVLAGILMGSPVWGFRPVRSLR